MVLLCMQRLEKPLNSYKKEQMELSCRLPGPSNISIKDNLTMHLYNCSCDDNYKITEMIGRDGMHR